MDFRFGVTMRAIGGDFATKCRRAEELGYDVITIPDHLGAPAPFPALVAAAAVTERVRVGPLVLNVPFYNAALLARDIESTVQVTGGRFDLGVGSGHMKREFDDAGLPWWPAKVRVGYLEHTLGELRERLPELPPLLIAGNSDGVLSLAAKQADIVGFAGLKQAPGKPPGSFDLTTADELAERVAFVRERAARELEFNMLIQHVVAREDPRAELDSWVPGYTADDLLAAPQIFAGPVARIAEQVQHHRERFGFTYFTVFESAMAAFAPVMDLVRPRPPA
jgi:probable F420-dependent oxidoreductase